MKVLIHTPENIPEHTNSWNKFWREAAANDGIEYSEVDLFRVSAIETLKDYDVLLWHFDNYSYEDMLEARSILYAAENMGLKVFPGFSEAWHFDDKIAEMYALQAAGARIPKSHVYYDIDTLKQAIDKKIISFPVIAKLRTGSGSHNVKQIHNEKQLIKYANVMFSVGLSPAPSLLYKTSSNIRSVKGKQDFIKRFKRIPEFLRNLKSANKFPNEKGYVYLQDFIPNDGYDLKVVVCGDKLSGLNRPVRSYDFRASGGGAVQYNQSLFSTKVIDLAFETAKRLNVKCVGFDMVIDQHTQEPYIIEMSYGFSNQAIMGMGGYFTRNGKWHATPLNAPHEILKILLASV